MNTTTLRNPSAPAAAPTDAQPPAAPWWTFGYVWLVLGGPAVVIVAGIATVWIAVTRPDPVVAEDYYRQGIEINRTLEAREQQAQRLEAERSLVPAHRARNHAATPTADLPPPAH